MKFSKAMRMFFKGKTEGFRMIYTSYLLPSIPPYKC